MEIPRYILVYFLKKSEYRKELRGVDSSRIDFKELLDTLGEARVAS